MDVPGVGQVWDWLTDEQLRTATLAGAATVPLTVVLGTGIIGDATKGSSGVPFLLACLFVGYVYSDRTVSSRRAGYRTGRVASLGTILVFLYPYATHAGPITATRAVMFGVVVVVGSVLAFEVFGLLGSVFARVGAAAADRLTSGRVAEN